MNVESSRAPNTLHRGSGTELTLEPSIVLIALDRPVRAENVEKSLTAVGAHLVTPEKSRDKAPPARMEINHTRKRFWCRVTRALADDDVASIEAALGARVRWIAPVYRTSPRAWLGQHASPLPNVLLLRFEKPMGRLAPELIGRLAELGLAHVEKKSRFLRPFHYFIISDLTRGNAYQLRDRVFGAGLGVVDVRYETMPLVKPWADEDPLLGDQWNMSKIGATGVPGEGWELSAGDPSVVVCILDSGCDLQHPDLRFASAGINTEELDGDGSPTGDHGTPCAGIAAAIFDNGVGVAGVAGNCSILPVAMENVTDVEVAAGIQWAADNGAHALSMSFGAFAPEDDEEGPGGWDFAIIDPAIEYAFLSGVVMAAASGNQNSHSHNLYPARHPLVMAVGASNKHDNRKRASDENDWGSNFAPGISVVAPGVGIVTTDRRGDKGFDTSSGHAGDYTSSFDGTSAATPHVAGLAALVRSTCPTKSNVDIRNIIERTADKAGTADYQHQNGFPNGTRTDGMGYGRISVARAVHEAFLFTLACLSE